MHLGQVASTLNIPIETLRDLNPQYKLDIIPATKRSYALRLPARYTSEFIANEKEIMKVYNALAKYFPSWVGYNMAKCGGCIRACVSMLEKKGGCMENRFKAPLRTKKAWKLDR